MFIAWEVKRSKKEVKTINCKNASHFTPPHGLTIVFTDVSFTVKFFSDALASLDIKLSKY